ncbi:ATP-binding protein [Streptomyces albidus (ex Kaewkla and Franco 2022)]|uniref:ATP-binding protein n=1 Tax=Streptomyces albidus (ex Kaewkla and Franco 2022) TaxID=722709 RepID=UPI0015EEDCEE|nr:ATP-binding protein [Streptomyces albidus (ex Kaewkla and Franco 2022)]
MPQEWAGESGRDRAVEAYVRELLVREPRSRPDLPATLLLGPRGSGKTTVLRHLGDWARRAPVARLDLATLGREGRKPIDVLAALVFQLNAKKRDFARLRFPSFGLLAIAVAARMDAADRDEAVRQMEQALVGPPGSRTEVINQLAQFAATVLGAPTVVTAALPLLPHWQRHWVRLRMRWRLARIRRRTADSSASVDGFLIDLNQRYGDRELAERRRAESVLFDAFLDDLRRAYGSQEGDLRRTTQCLVLLDNVDSPLGNDFLRALLDARRKAEVPDPLLVLATAGSYPAALESFAFGGPRPPGVLPGRWPEDQERFRPEQVVKGLVVGRLRDLARREVERQAEEVLRSAAGRQIAPPAADNGVQWLGWVVHELTRGHPAGTAQLLAALLEHAGDIGWEDRIRRSLEPDAPLVGSLLERLLPIDASGELTAALARGAAAVDLAQAQSGAVLWAEADARCQDEFHDFCTDVLRTMHLDRGDESVDGPPETPHPLLRFLLLRRLASVPAPRSGDGTSDGSPGARDRAAVHAALGERAAAADDDGGAAYHALAAGDLATAAGHLDRAVDRLTPEEWCAELCRLRRAPLHGLGGPSGQPLWERYERLVSHLNEGAVDQRLRTVTRLLAAVWLGPEPPDDPGTDRVGDPYRDPLGDPRAELYGEIQARFHTLAVHADSVQWTSVLLRKAKQYGKEPWL